MTFDEAVKAIKAKYPGMVFGLHCEVWCAGIVEDVTLFTVSAKNFFTPGKNGKEGKTGDKHFQAYNLAEAVAKCLNGGEVEQSADSAIPPVSLEQIKGVDDLLKLGDKTHPKE